MGIERLLCMIKAVTGVYNLSLLQGFESAEAWGGVPTVGYEGIISDPKGNGSLVVRPFVFLAL